MCFRGHEAIHGLVFYPGKDVYKRQCVDSVRPRAYTEEDQLLLHRFARHLARQVHSAGLACDAEDLRRYFTRLEQLSELSAQNPHWRDYLGAFLRLMAESTEFEYVAFATAQEGGSTYTVEGENTPLLLSLIHI